MKLSFEEISQSVNHINAMIKNEFHQEAYIRYTQLEKEIELCKCEIMEMTEKERAHIAEFYANFAYFLFSISDYESFFEKYIEAQNYGFLPEKRRKFLYEAFVEPNLSEFKANYYANLNVINFMPEYEFEELQYWLITSGVENQFYIYDKETNLLYDNVDFEISKADFNINGVSDVLVTGGWNWDRFKISLEDVCSYEKFVYVIDEKPEKILSYFQGTIFDKSLLSYLVLFQNWSSFVEYFKTESYYLPQVFIGDQENKETFCALKKEIHEYRINNDNRKRNNVLLSIGIPSYNRGKRAYENINHLLKSELDEEIEVVLSNNGTKNGTHVYYEEISRIRDSRFTYFAFEENQGVALNISRVAEMSNGKFVLLLSDEDLIDLNQLNLIVNILRALKNEYGVIRVKSDKQNFLPFIGVAEPGLDALMKFMLTSNYLSGIIFSNDILKQYELVEKVRQNLHNESVLMYPHMVWELELCQYAKVIGLEIVLVNEGKAEKSELSSIDIGERLQKNIPYYATFQGRMAQHKGFYEIIKDLVVSSDLEILRELYKKLCAKTLFLVSLSLKSEYAETDEDLNILMESTYKECLKYLDEIYYGRKNSNKFKFTEDQTMIRQYYLNSKSQI